MLARVAGIVAAALVFAVTAEARPHTVPGGCRHRPGRTILTSGRARVFEIGNVHYNHDIVTVAYGCASRSGRRVLLEQDTDPFHLSRFALSGHFVAYQSAECPAGCATELFVVNLRTGHVHHETTATRSDVVAQQQLAFGVLADELLVNRRGSIAWTAGVCDVDENPCTQTTEEVWGLGLLGMHRLDAGHAVAPDSLTLKGPVATWTDAGVARSARID